MLKEDIIEKKNVCQNKIFLTNNMHSKCKIAKSYHSKVNNVPKTLTKTCKNKMHELIASRDIDYK